MEYQLSADRTTVTSGPCDYCGEVLYDLDIDAVGGEPDGTILHEGACTWAWWDERKADE